MTKLAKIINRRKWNTILTVMTEHSGTCATVLVRKYDRDSSAKIDCLVEKLRREYLRLPVSIRTPGPEHMDFAEFLENARPKKFRMLPSSIATIYVED